MELQSALYTPGLCHSGWPSRRAKASPKIVLPQPFFINQIQNADTKGLPQRCAANRKVLHPYDKVIKRT